MPGKNRFFPVCCGQINSMILLEALNDYFLLVLLLLFCLIMGLFYLPAWLFWKFGPLRNWLTEKRIPRPWQYVILGFLALIFALAFLYLHYTITREGVI